MTRTSGVYPGAASLLSSPRTISIHLPSVSPESHLWLSQHAEFPPAAMLSWTRHGTCCTLACLVLKVWPSGYLIFSEDGLTLDHSLPKRCLSSFGSSFPPVSSAAPGQIRSKESPFGHTTLTLNIFHPSRSRSMGIKLKRDTIPTLLCLLPLSPSTRVDIRINPVPRFS